jgi:hypothetical protein
MVDASPFWIPHLLSSTYKYIGISYDPTISRRPSGTWWRPGDRRGKGGVCRPPIRRVRSQILLYLVKPMFWVEVCLVIPFVFITDEPALQVKNRLQSPSLGRKAHGTTNAVFIERNVLQECLLSSHIKLTTLIRCLRGCFIVTFLARFMVRLVVTCLYAGSKQ